MNLPLSVYDFFGYLASGFLILAAAEFGFDGQWLLDRDWKPGSIVLYVTMAYIIGHISANLSSDLIENRFGRKLLGPSEELLFRPADANNGCWSYLFPGFFKPLPVKTQTRVLEAAEPEGLNMPGRDLYLHAFAIAKQDKNTLDRLNTFLNLYGFCRNIAFALIVSALIITASGPWYAFLGVHELDWKKVGAVALCVGGAIGMLYRYLKFYRLYTHEVFISYPELKKKADAKPSDPKKE